MAKMFPTYHQKVGHMQDRTSHTP